MARIESAGKTLIVSPGSFGEEIIYRVPDGFKAKVKSCVIGFPVGTNFELAIKAVFGNIAIIPNQGEIRGDGMVIPIEAEFTLNSGEAFKIQYKNDNSTSIRIAFVLAIFEVE